MVTDEGEVRVMDLGLAVRIRETMSRYSDSSMASPGWCCMS